MPCSGGRPTSVHKERRPVLAIHDGSLRPRHPPVSGGDHGGTLGLAPVGEKILHYKVQSLFETDNIVRGIEWSSCSCHCPARRRMQACRWIEQKAVATLACAAQTHMRDDDRVVVQLGDGWGAEVDAGGCIRVGHADQALVGQRRRAQARRPRRQPQVGRDGLRALAMDGQEVLQTGGACKPSLLACRRSRARRRSCSGGGTLARAGRESAAGRQPAFLTGMGSVVANCSLAATARKSRRPAIPRHMVSQGPGRPPNNRGWRTECRHC